MRMEGAGIPEEVSEKGVQKEWNRGAGTRRKGCFSELILWSKSDLEAS